jgi:phosphoenolpyruvate-protein kinase (PTS system EI component)
MDAKQYAKLQALSTMTPAQVQTWVQNNVNTLADAKDALKTLAVAVGILARRL